MAVSQSVDIVSVDSGSTFASGDLYKFVTLNASGAVVLPATTGNILPFGVLYGVTSTTNAGQAVPVAIGGIAKIRMAGSTQAAGAFIGSSTSGLGIAPTTDAYVAAQIVSGSSGSTGRIVTGKLLSGSLGAV